MLNARDKGVISPIFIFGSDSLCAIIYKHVKNIPANSNKNIDYNYAFWIEINEQGKIIHCEAEADFSNPIDQAKKDLPQLIQKINFWYPAIDAGQKPIEQYPLEFSVLLNRDHITVTIINRAGLIIFSNRILRKH